jgi:alcohol dehydrogenase (cytochrome c)
MTEQPAAAMSQDQRGKRRRLWQGAAVAVFLIGALGAIAVYKIHVLHWRADVVLAKARGNIDDISWAELLTWIKPGSDLHLEPLSVEPNPFASLVNSYTSDDDRMAGEQLFLQHCSICHGAEGEGKSAPSLVERSFEFGSSDWALFRTTTRGVPAAGMPALDIPGKSAWQIVSYLRFIQTNASRPEADTPARIPPTFSVSNEQIEQAVEEPFNWLTYSGTYNGQRHSALGDIDKENVETLKLAWSLQLQTADSIETSPIVVDGIMFVTEPPSNVLAIDAGTGEVIWRHQRDLPPLRSVCCGRVNRGVAVLGNSVFIGTLDGKLVALDARTGAVRWEKLVAEHTEGFTLTGAPLAVADLVIVGVGGGDYGIRGFLDAYDASSGERRWRFYTIPEPGEPGSDTWSGDAWQKGGGATWVTGAFDPSLGLLYWGVGNPAPDFNGDVRPGDNLYTDSVVALDVATGELEWYFQFTPHDEHDWDANQVPVLIDHDVDGRSRQLMLWANRNGFYYVLDRATGEFLNARAFVQQTWAEGMDPNGRPILVPGARPSERGALVWPGVIGGANWWSPTYSPLTDMFYTIGVEQPSVFSRSTTGADPSEHRPGDPSLGSGVTTGPSKVVLRALEPITGERIWENELKVRQDLSEISGLLSTQGDLLFLGDRTDFLALDTRSGAELWRVNLGGNINANPVTFAVEGRQLVTISAGNALFSFGL